MLNDIIFQVFNGMLSSNIFQTFVDQSNANIGLLSFIGTLVPVILFIGRSKWLFVPAASVSLFLLWATTIFLTPLDGHVASIPQPPSSSQAPNNREATPATPAMSSADATLRQPTGPMGYEVTGVNCNDVLNIRSQPALFSDGAIVGSLSCHEDNIEILGPTRRIGYSEWWLIKAANSRGWVNARYLAQATQPPVQETARGCNAIQNIAFQQDASNSQCRLMPLSSGIGVESVWTGSCDSDQLANGFGIARSYSLVNGERRLTAIFFGRIQNGASFSGILSRDGQISRVCSDATGLSKPQNTAARNTARSDAIRGIDAGIAIFRQAKDRNAEEFYIDFRSRLMNAR